MATSSVILHAKEYLLLLLLRSMCSPVIAFASDDLEQLSLVGSEPYCRRILCDNCKIYFYCYLYMFNPLVLS